jgi:hypothetical protein
MRISVDLAVKLSEQSFPCRNLAIASLGGLLHEPTDLFQIAPEFISRFLSVKKSTTRDIQTPSSQLACASVIINRAIGDRAREQSHTAQQARSFEPYQNQNRGGNETPIVLLAGPQLASSARVLLLTTCT